MSGTSLDGVDLAACEFVFEDGRWKYRIEAAETFAYSGEWKSRLASVEKGTARELALADIELGILFGNLSKTFLEKHKLTPGFIASHGHTIFHEPARMLTCQIGKGSYIAANAGLPVISDFRSLDVACNGQGAPLVPVGDKLLFGEYDYCLNLGGFGNISYKNDGKRLAFDTCPVNIVMNHYARLAGSEFDMDGALARKGNLNEDLLRSLDGLSFYKTPAPKSLGKEWVVAEVLPLIESFQIPIEDKLRTFTEHVSGQIASVIAAHSQKKVLVTGGGALNRFLIERLRSATKASIVLPDVLTINFKEALIFAFLGVLRWRNEPNCLSSVTGAKKDNSGGCIYSWQDGNFQE
jgi:anhydro-N-acetylmuramic acid kinase